MNYTLKTMFITAILSEHSKKIKIKIPSQIVLEVCLDPHRREEVA